MVPLSLAWAFVLSVVGGAIVTILLMYGLLRALVWQEIVKDSKRVWWLVALVGCFERAAVTALTIWAPTVVPVFVGGWVLLKFAGGWGRYKDTKLETRSVYQVGLIGNLVSIGWAILAGVIYRPEILTNFRPA